MRPPTTSPVALIAGLLGLVALVSLAPAAVGDAAKKPSVKVTPGEITSGERITVRGKGFKPKAKVKLLVGPPRSEATPVTKTRTNRRGRFRKRIRFDGPGRWVLLACRRSCAVKAQDSFVVAPR